MARKKLTKAEEKKEVAPTPEVEETEAPVQAEPEVAEKVTKKGSNPRKEHIAVKGKMAEILAAEPKRPVYIPLSAGEKAGVTLQVTINGHAFFIRKGQMVNVPESVAAIVERKLRVRAEAENHPDKLRGENPRMTQFGG